MSKANDRVVFIGTTSATMTDAVTEEEPRRRGRPVSKKEDIIRAAVKVFLENGYAGTSVNRVAEEAGVIKATIYSHFKDKESLFSAIIEEITVKKMAVDFPHIEALIPSLGPEQFIDMIYEKFSKLEEDQEYCRLVRILIGESERFPELPELYLRVVLRPGMGLARMYFDKHPELGIEDSFAAGHIMAGAFWSLLVWQRILGGVKETPLRSDRVKAVLKDFLLSKKKLTAIENKA